MANCSGARRSSLPEHFGDVQTRVLCGSRPQGGDENLERALEGLERCDFVAVTERLDESAIWLARRLGWDELGPLPRANVATDRLKREQLSAETLGALLKLTSFDAQLHRHAAQRFERQIAKWSQASDPRDEGASFPDAPVVADLQFGEPIQGRGWSGREQLDEEPWFGWIGASRRAHLYLRAAPKAERLLIEIPHVLEPAILDTLRITVNGEIVSHSFGSRDGVLTATATMPTEVVTAFEGTVHVQLEVGRTVRPCDLDPESNDSRDLAIAVRRVALVHR